MRVMCMTRPEELTLPAGYCVVARLRGLAIGCGALKLHGAAPAELKKMWVDPGSRGLGVGRRLLVSFEELARENGVRALHLETNRALEEAIELYRRPGFVEVAPFSAVRSPLVREDADSTTSNKRIAW